MFVSLLQRVEHTLNNTPAPSEPQLRRPIMILEGKDYFDAKKSRLPFGTPAYTYTDSDNIMEPRVTPSIALRKSNDAGMFFIMECTQIKKM